MLAQAAALWSVRVAHHSDTRARRPRITYEVFRAAFASGVAGYRTVGIRERIAQRNGTWHDNVFIERRADTVDRPGC